MRKRTLLAVVSAAVSVGIFLITALAQTVSPEDVGNRRAELEKELSDLEGQIDGFRSLILGKQQESASFERDISILDAQIKKAQLEIKARDIAIKNIINSIGAKSVKIDELLSKVGREKNSLSELLRRLDELDHTSLIETLIGGDDLSEFFAELDNMEAVQQSIHESIALIRETKLITENEIDDLEARKAEENQLKSLQVLEKNRIEERETEKKNLLKITKGKEAEYQKVLSAKQKDAATIRSQLFLLTGSPDIPFERAVELANKAFQKTGVRPAFLLGVIAEESNLGANVGTGNWREDLSHSRCAKQRTAFQEITSELGLNPDLMPVSKKAWYGYCGGAMGPAQFIPTTWLLYKNLVARHTGHNPPNPWDAEDAFMASALLLKDNGAAEGTYQAERRAALRYLAGGNWSKPAYAFYGDDVMSLASKYQEQMNIILAQR
ncbi:MAG: lytic murein transglycosylase [Candidatus Niyogibacteria bacterium]|nr:MAG: lytic murein transglycosylase [Candidatus Niyogibacteria bacterium]